MDNLIRKLTQLSYKSRFNIYNKEGVCLVRVYFKDGTQHKEVGFDILDALNKMINYLEIANLFYEKE